MMAMRFIQSISLKIFMSRRSIFYFADKTLFILPILISIAVIYTLTPFGAASTPDSLHYYSIANNFFLGNGLTLPGFDINGPDFIPVTMWPPLYPAFLSFFLLFNPEIEMAARCFNMLSLSITLLAFILISLKIVRWPWAVLATIFFIFQPPVMTVYAYGWSETLFIPLVLLSYYFALAAKETAYFKNKIINYLISTLLIILAANTRYLGAVFLIPLLIMVIVDMRHNLKNALWSILAISVCFLAGLLPTLIHNHIHAGYLSGAYRGASETQLFVEIEKLIVILKINMLNFQNLLLWGLIAVIIASLIYSRLLSKNQKSVIKNNDPAYQSCIIICWSTLLWFFCYAFFLIIARLIQNIDSIDTRLISPVMPFLILFIFAFFKCQVHLSHKTILAPLLIWISAQSIYGVNLYSNNVESWYRERKPRFPLDDKYFYVDFTEYITKSRESYAVLKLNAGSLVLSDQDVDSLIILSHQVKPAKVKMLPATLTPQNVQLINAKGQQGGVVIINNSKGLGVLESAYGTKLKLPSAIHLPLPTPTNSMAVTP